MLSRALLAFFLLVVAEFWLLIRAGALMGPGRLLLLLLGTAALGVWVTSREWARLRAGLQGLNRTSSPAPEVWKPLGALVGGLLLLIPGILTDGLGLLLILPGSRDLLAAPLARYTRGLGIPLARRPDRAPSTGTGREPLPRPRRDDPDSPFNHPTF